MSPKADRAHTQHSLQQQQHCVVEYSSRCFAYLTALHRTCCSPLLSCAHPAALTFIDFTAQLALL